MTDELREIVTGVTEGTIRANADIIKDWGAKILNRQLACYGGHKTINLIKASKSKPEWKIYNQFIKDKDLRTIIQLGITLRRINDPGERKELQKKIFRRYKEPGLHIAQFVQNKLLTKYFSIILEWDEELVETPISLDKMKEIIEQSCVFVKSSEKSKDVILKLTVKLQAHNPPIFMVFASGDALAIAEETIESFKKEATKENYELQIFEDEEHFRKTWIFIKRTPLD